MSDAPQVNYGPLEDVDHAWSVIFKNSVHGWGSLPLVLAIVLMIGFAVLGVANAAVLPPVLYFAYLAARVTKYRNSLWQSFALANGWSFDNTTPFEEQVPPSLLFGHSLRLGVVIQAALGAVTADLFTYNCTTGSGRSQQTHVFTVARVALAAPLPHILLLSKKNRAAVQRDLLNAQTLKLEGDFQDYFTMQIEAGQQLNVLEILTPDVMQTLVQANQAEDIETAGNFIWFILNSDKRDARQIQALIDSVVALSVQITENLQHDNVPAVQ